MHPLCRDSWSPRSCPSSRLLPPRSRSRRKSLHSKPASPGANSSRPSRSSRTSGPSRGCRRSVCCASWSRRSCRTSASPAHTATSRRSGSRMQSPPRGSPGTCGRCAPSGRRKCARRRGTTRPWSPVIRVTRDSRNRRLRRADEQARSERRRRQPHMVPKRCGEMAVTREPARECDLGEVRGRIRLQHPDRPVQLHLEAVGSQRLPVRAAERARQVGDRTPEPSCHLPRRKTPRTVSGDHGPGAIGQLAGSGTRTHGRQGTVNRGTPMEKSDR
jgi:hypothetical protein